MSDGCSSVTGSLCAWMGSLRGRTGGGKTGVLCPRDTIRGPDGRGIQRLQESIRTSTEPTLRISTPYTHLKVGQRTGWDRKAGGPDARAWTRNSAGSSTCRQTAHCRMRHGESAVPEKMRFRRRWWWQGVKSCGNGERVESRGAGRRWDSRRDGMWDAVGHGNILGHSSVSSGGTWPNGGIPTCTAAGNVPGSRSLASSHPGCGNQGGRYSDVHQATCV